MQKITLRLIESSQFGLLVSLTTITMDYHMLSYVRYHTFIKILQTFY